MAKKKALAPPRPPRPEVLAFLDAIMDDPDDDVPRLVLADWLEEHGDEADAARGRYLRLSCQRLKLPAGDAQRRSVEEEWKRLYQQYGSDWMGPLATIAEVSKHNVKAYLRFTGLIDVYGRPLGLCARYCLPIYQTEAFAWVDEVHVDSGGPLPMAKLLASPLTQRLHGLTIRAGYSPLREAGAKALAAVGRLVSLKRLSLRGNFIGPAGLTALAQAPALTNLRHLDLSHNQLQRGSVAVLANSPGLRRLRRLDLSEQIHLEDGVGHLSGAEWLAGLRSLSLAQTWATDAGLIALLASPRVSNLDNLDLRMNKLTDAGLEAIASCPHLGALTALRLGGDGYHSGNPVGRRGLEALAASPLLGRLQCLDLRHCRGRDSDQAVHVLTRSPHWGQLRVLTLSGLEFGPAGAARLAEASAAGRIDRLALGACRVGDEGADALADAMRRGTIGRVDLTYNNLSEARRSALQAEFGDRVEINY